MCTNYRPTARDIVRERFAAELPAEAYPDEVFPGYLAPMVRRRNGADGEREALLGRFGLIPHWAKEDKIGRHTYNARSETVAEKPSFRDAWRNAQRCIVPMDAFYEPNWDSGKAVRWRIQLATAQPFGVAGLWARWRAPTGVGVHSFTMLTVNADLHPVMKRFHKPGDEKRSLVLLAPQDYDAWLDAPVEDAFEWLKPAGDDVLAACADPAPVRARK